MTDKSIKISVPPVFVMINPEYPDSKYEVCYSYANNIYLLESFLLEEDALYYCTYRLNKIKQVKFHH